MQIATCSGQSVCVAMHHTHANTVMTAIRVDSTSVGECNVESLLKTLYVEESTNELQNTMVSEQRAVHNGKEATLWATLLRLDNAFVRFIHTIDR